MLQSQNQFRDAVEQMEVQYRERLVCVLTKREMLRSKGFRLRQS